MDSAGRDTAERRHRESERTALRRLATLVERETSPVEIFNAVTEEACRVLETEAVGLLRFEPDESATLIAQSDTPWDPPPPGTRFTLDGENVVTQVFHTGRTARMDDWADSTGSVAAMASVLGVRSAVASPVVVKGRPWGIIIAATSQSEPLPPETESRIGQFARLVETAIANAQARGELSRLAEEQAALRRVAVLVAQQPSPEEVFTAVTEVVANLLGADLAAMHVFRGGEAATVLASWSQGGPALPVGTQLPLDGDSAVARIFHTAGAARIDSYRGAEGETAGVARELRLRSAVGAPILVEGKLWGALMAAVRGDEPLAADAEARIAAFTELVATAVANAQAREELQRLADEQAALRHVATLVAQQPSPEEIFEVVSVEVARVFGFDAESPDIAGVVRFEPGPALVAVGASKLGEAVKLGVRFPTDELYVSSQVLRTGQSARVGADDLDSVGGETADWFRHYGLLSQVGSPIVVEGRLWGAMTVNSGNEFPADTEERLERFTELVATAIANAESHDALARIADEQAALRRVATLVARGIGPEEVFRAVAAEVGVLFGADVSAIVRFDDDGMVTVLGDIGGPHASGKRVQLDEGYVVYQVRETSRSARFDTHDPTAADMPSLVRALGILSAVASPIAVEGKLWGAITAASVEGPLPSIAEPRLTEFTDLVATAVANAQAHVAVRRAADEQGALRRVATLVAASAAPSDVFAAVTKEIALVLGADTTLLCRADPDGAAVVVGTWSDNLPGPPLGTRIGRGGTNLTTIVLDTGQPSRMETYEDATGEASEVARSHGLRSAVGAPILVEGRLWGLVIAGTTGDELLPPDAEARLAGFTELVATAISNATVRAELVASRARIVEASDETRRRIERDLHDGTQQRLVTLGLAVRAAEANVPPERDDLRGELSGVAQGLAAAVEDLQELSRGIHPAILSKGGLGAALQTLAHRSAIPVDLDIGTDVRLPEPIEVAAYFVVSEALANAAKHSEASRIDVSLEQHERSLVLSVRDDGVGGADAARGSGLLGLIDRVEALGGFFRVYSRPGKGTQVTADLPLEFELPQPVG